MKILTDTCPIELKDWIRDVKRQVLFCLLTNASTNLKELKVRMYSHGLGEPGQHIGDWMMGLVTMTQHIFVDCLAGMQKPVVSLWAFVTVQ